MHNSELVVCVDCYEKGNFELVSQEEFKQENLLEHFNYAQLVKDEDWDVTKTAELINALKRHGEDWDKVAQAVGVDRGQAISKYLTLPMQDLIEAENEKEIDYLSPLPNRNKEFDVHIDLKEAMENAKIARKNEEIEIDSILNEMIEIQSKKIEIKSKFINEMKDLLDIRMKSMRMKMQQLVNANYLMALSKSRDNEASD